jgi:hypothetical protein
MSMTIPQPIYLTASLLILVIIPGVISAAGNNIGDWKRGRIYYRLVCNACHKEEIGQAISPGDFTIAEWKAIIDEEKHAPASNANPSILYYVSRGYREWIKRDNRAAEKFLDIPEQDLLNDVRSFVLQGAKDSDTPVRCK